MKKYIIMLAAALGLAASCQKQELVYFDPVKVVAPVLESVSSVLIDTENIETGKATFAWAAADFGINTQIYYSIEAYKEGTDTTVLATNLTGTKADISFSAMNEKLLFDLKLAAGMPESVNFILAAKLNKGDKYYSAPVTATVTVVEADKTYPGVYVLGEFNGWKWDKAQFLFDYDETGLSYQGVIGLGKKAADGFKITGAASWDIETGNWGVGDPAPSAESAAITLVDNGSDIKIYSKSYYHFSFEKESLGLKVTKGFNSISAVLNGTELPMSFNTTTQKFFVDAEVEAGSKIQFKFDDGTVLGGEINALKTGGNAITYSAAGKYRITLNMNKWNSISAVFDKGAYGAGEEGGEEETSASWGIVGEFNEWGASADIAMTLVDGYHVATGVEFSANEQFKFRKNGQWGEERTYDGVAKADTEYFVAVGDKNITVETAGTYDVYLTEGLDKFYLMTAGKTPADAEKAPEPETVTMTVYSDNADFTHLYGWWDNEGAAHFTDAWPGSAFNGTETIEGVTYKKLEIKLDKALFETAKIKLILNDGKSEGAAQTSDSDALTPAKTIYISVADNKVVLKGNTGEDVPEVETVPVTFYCDNASYTHIYGWWNADITENWFTQPWPGNASSQKETIEGVEYVKWVVNVDKARYEAKTTVQIILNDGKSEGAAQTADSDKITLAEKVFLTISDNKPVVKGEGSGNDEETPGDDQVIEKVTVTVYCDVDKTYLYGFWTSDNSYFTAAWPGSANSGKETVEGVEYVKWTLDVSKEHFDAAVKVKLVLSNGGDDNKTEDSAELNLTETVFLTIDGSNTPVIKTFDDDDNQGSGEQPGDGNEGGTETPGDGNEGSTDTPGDDQEDQTPAAWSIVGDFTSWSNDIPMYEVGDHYLAKNVHVPENSTMKFRKDKEWEEVRTVKASIDTERRYAVSNDKDGESNIVIATEGNYDFYLAKDLGSMIMVNTGTDLSTASIVGLWSIAGTFNEWGNPDILMYETNDWLIAKEVEIEEGDEFKFRKSQGWDEVRTYNGTVTANTEYTIEHNSDENANIVVSTTGTYDIYINHLADTFYLMETGKTPGQN